MDNPGGSDNSSFCSNSACHGTQWKYVGLNAPKIRQLITPPKVPSSGVPNAIPHPIGARTDCTLCHGIGKIRPYPDNHTSFKPEMCSGCHKPTVQEAAPAVATPAPTAAPGTSARGRRPRPHPLESAARRPFPTTWPAATTA